jgi:succinate dehydrogenase/fumarate reductase flavoprotein subunit
MAGTFSAINIKNTGLDVTLVSKGPVGKSGGSIFAGNFPLSGPLLKNSDSRLASSFDRIKYFNSFLVDQDHNDRIGEWAGTHLWPDLERDGLYLRRNNDGTLATSLTSGKVAVGLRHGQSGMLLMDLRRKQLFKSGVRVIEEAMATALLRDSAGNINGAVVLDIPSGDILSIHARAVILATGHSDRLAERSTATREQSADGLAMAWRAGAELENLEINWWHVGDLAQPTSWQRWHIYPNPTVNTAESARLYNSRGDLFFDLATHAPKASVPYVVQQKRLTKQVEQGNARFDGGYYASYAHIDPDILKSFNAQSHVWDRLGLDVGSDALETAATWHFRGGGIHTNLPDLTTSVPGLFVAGAVGAHYIGGVPSVNYDGYAVAGPIVSYLQSSSPALFETTAAAKEADRLEARRNGMSDSGITPAQVKRKLRHIMSTHMGPVKDELSMTRALEDLARLRESDLPNMGLRSTTRRFNQSWVDSIDVDNLCLVAELTVRSSRLRTESRGPFYRADYPFTNNRDWLCRHIIAPSDEQSVISRTELIHTPHLKPEADISPYFDLDW